MYFVVGLSESGMFIDSLSQSELQKRLEEHYYGGDYVFLEQLPDGEWDWPCEGGAKSLVVIKGEVIVIKPKEVVVKFDVP